MKALPTKNWRHCFSLHILIVNQLYFIPLSVPEQVLREHPDAPCYHNLRHSELNIEIRPWKVSDVRTSVTTEVASQQNDVTNSGDKVVESSGDDDEEEEDSASNSSEVNDDDIETPASEVTSSDMNVAGQNVMAEIVLNDSNNNSFLSSPDGSHLKVATSETDVCGNMQETSCEELRTCEGTCNFDGTTLPSEEILRNNNSETAENEHNAVARMIAQRMLLDLIKDDKNDTSGGTTMSEENALEHNVVEEAIDTEMVSQSRYAINDTSELSNVEDPSSVNATSDTNLNKQSNSDLATPSKDTALTNIDVNGPMDGNCSSKNVDSEDIDSIVNENNAVAQMIADKMLSEHHSPEQSADAMDVPVDGKPERSNITSQKRDQIDAALVDSDDEQSPAKVQKVSRSLMFSEENVDKRLDQINAPATALADAEEMMPEMALPSDVEKSEIEGKTTDYLETGREESSITGSIKDDKETEAPERQHVDLAQVLETSEDLPHGTTVHVMHQVECLAEEPEKELLVDGDLANRTSTSNSAGETMTPPTKSNWIISVDDEAGTSVDPQDHEPTTGEDETNLIPVDSDGPGRPGSVVKGTFGESKDKAWVTIEETEMLEKVITAERAGLVVVDEVDTANVDSDGEDAGKADAVSKSDMDVPAPNDRCKQQEVSDMIKAQPHENLAIDEGMPLSVESEKRENAIRSQREERRPIAAVQPRQSQTQSDIERRDVEDILPARETGSMVTERHDGRQSPVLGHYHPSNVDSIVPLEHDLEESDFAEEQPMNTGIGSTAQVSEVTAEEDVRVELLESPRRNIEHKEHIPSPRGKELHQPIVVRQISESLASDATNVKDDGRNSTTQQRENDEGSYNAFQEAHLIGKEEITEEELARFRGVNLRGRSVTPMRHTRPGSHRRSRSLSPHALEDAFFKMAEADSRKCLVESAIQTDPLSSASSSSKSSPKHRLKQTKGSPRLTHRESSSNTSRSISPIDSSSESSALVQQALATIRSAMETKTEYSPESMRSPTEQSGEEQQQICQNNVQKREEVSGRTENVCLQTGDSLDDIPAATEVEEAPGEIVDQTCEPELEHSSVLLQDPNSSDQFASSDSNEHPDHMAAAENLNSDMPSSIVPRSSTSTSSEEVYPCQHVDLSLTQEEGRTRDQASGVDTTFVPEVLEDQQESYESPENSDAITVVSVSVGRVDPMQNTALAAQTITDVPPEVLEAASGQRSFAVQAGDADERDGDVTSGDAVGHRSFAVQATDLDTEVDVRTTDDLSIPENVLDFSEHLDIATGQRSMAIQAVDLEDVEAVRSFGVQVFVQDLGRPTAESGDELQRPVTGSGPLSEALEAASNTDTDNHPPFTSGVENMNNSVVSDLERGEISSLSTAQTRTIETQTYPELRVIETQTSLDMHCMETQTSPKELVEGEATQTEVFSMEEISVQTPAEMAISGKDWFWYGKNTAYLFLSFVPHHHCVHKFIDKMQVSVSYEVTTRFSPSFKGMKCFQFLFSFHYQ